jgi:hypothetical protein
MKIPKSWWEELQEAKAEAEAENAEPWRVRLERLRGKVGDDGIERITTQAVFDILEIPQRSRGAGACRRLSAAMRDLGWAPVHVRWLQRAGSRVLSRCSVTPPHHCVARARHSHCCRHLRA